MPEKKASKPHIKIYFPTVEEETAVREHAKSLGLSASAWFRSWALKQLKRGK